MRSAGYGIRNDEARLRSAVARPRPYSAFRIPDSAFARCSSTEPRPWATAVSPSLICLMWPSRGAVCVSMARTPMATLARLCSMLLSALPIWISAAASAATSASTSVSERIVRTRRMIAPLRSAVSLIGRRRHGRRLSRRGPLLGCWLRPGQGLVDGRGVAVDRLRGGQDLAGPAVGLPEHPDRGGVAGDLLPGVPDVRGVAVDAVGRADDPQQQRRDHADHHAAD